MASDQDKELEIWSTICEYPGLTLDLVLKQCESAYAGELARRKGIEDKAARYFLTVFAVAGVLAAAAAAGLRVIPKSSEDSVAFAVVWLSLTSGVVLVGSTISYTWAHAVLRVTVRGTIPLETLVPTKVDIYKDADAIKRHLIYHYHSLIIGIRTANETRSKALRSAESASYVTSLCVSFLVLVFLLQIMLRAWRLS